MITQEKLKHLLDTGKISDDAFLAHLSCSSALKKIRKAYVSNKVTRKQYENAVAKATTIFNSKIYKK